MEGGKQEREKRKKEKEKKKGKKTIDGSRKGSGGGEVQVADFFTGTDCTRVPATVSGAASRYALAKNTSDR